MPCANSNLGKVSRAISNGFFSVFFLGGGRWGVSKKCQFKFYDMILKTPELILQITSKRKTQINTYVVYIFFKLLFIDCSVVYYTSKRKFFRQSLVDF